MNTILAELLGMDTQEKSKIRYKHIQGGNVPGGHNVIYKDNEKTPFITPTKECSSIPLEYTDVVVDIGAYVGTYAIRCARLPVRHVYAYEPTEQTHSILSLTKLPNMTTCRMAVVGDPAIKTVELNISKGIGVTNSIILGQKSRATTETVDAIQYKNAVKDASIIKIDVEGAEYSYSGQLITDKTRAIIIDFHKVGNDWKIKAERLIEEIHDHGFTTVIKPNFERSGWDQAGSWIREAPVKLTDVYEPMMLGLECCGCGVEIRSTDKSLCTLCWNNWKPQHKKGFKCIT
jgi:FkbM family methyltransferase